MHAFHRLEAKIHRPPGASTHTGSTLRIVLPCILSAIVILLLVSHCRDVRFRARQGAASSSCRPDRNLLEEYSAGGTFRMKGRLQGKGQLGACCLTKGPAGNCCRTHRTSHPQLAQLLPSRALSTLPPAQAQPTAPLQLLLQLATLAKQPPSLQKPQARVIPGMPSNQPSTCDDTQPHTCDVGVPVCYQAVYVCFAWSLADAVCTFCLVTC